MFQTFYESTIQHPLLLLVAPFLFLIKIWDEKSRLGRSLLVFTVLTLLDPLMTGPLTQLLSLSDEQAEFLAIFFVILGDFRWFFFLYLGRLSLLQMLLLSLIVPVAQLMLIQIWPDTFDSARLVYLAYEGLFLVLALIILLIKDKGLSLAQHRFRRAICLYGVAYYALWITADLIILAHSDLGFLLRVLPNQLYYSFFLPFVWWKARSLQLN